jgi:hypothetical protein
MNLFNIFFKNPFKGPQKLWTKTNKGIVIEYPILYIDLEFPEHAVIKLTISQILGDVDFWGFDVENARIIDSSGKVFIINFETNGSWRSGIFPDKFAYQSEISEVQKIVKVAVNEIAFKIENIDKLLTHIDLAPSIKDVFLICNEYLQ